MANFIHQKTVTGGKCGFKGYTDTVATLWLQPAFHAIPCDGSVEDDAMIALCWYLSFSWSGQHKITFAPKAV